VTSLCLSANIISFAGEQRGIIGFSGASCGRRLRKHPRVCKWRGWSYLILPIPPDGRKYYQGNIYKVSKPESRVSICESVECFERVGDPETNGLPVTVKPLTLR
jgi:hypothetical protein